MKKISRVLCIIFTILLVLTVGCTKEDDKLNFTKEQLRRVKFDNDKVLDKHIFGHNQCSHDFTKDRKEGKVLKLSTSINQANDPFVSLNLGDYLREIGDDSVKGDEYKVVLLKIKVSDMISCNFELFYATGNSTTIEIGHSKTSIYDNSSEKWQYVLFDMTKDPNWTDSINVLRFDFATAAVSKGETMYISEIMFAKDMDIACQVMGLDISTELENILDAKTEEYIKKLLSIEDPETEYSKYAPLTAANEDKNINMWFNHTYTRTPEGETTPGDMKTYQLRLAKNELEACQLIFSTKQDYSNMTLEITDFTNKNGKTLRTELLYGYYFEVREEMIIDPLPPLDGPFDLKANKSKTFVIKVMSTLDSEAGEYVATVTLKDSSGQEVKKAKVFAYVWDFELPEETSCKTLMDTSSFAVYTLHGVHEEDDEQLYKNYYDFLLENRINSYTLPYSTEYYSDPRIVEYLDNPRVRAFLNMGWKRKLTGDNVKHSYDFLSQKQEWLDKTYFYPVDEPIDITMLDQVRTFGEIIKQNFPNHKLLVPMHFNLSMNPESTMDHFEYVADYVTAWCPKTFFFNTYEDYKKNPYLTYYMSGMLEKNLGTFPERMAKHQAEGDDVWWYVTRVPNYPEITLTMETKAVKYRVLFWQQKLYNVDNFLYYMTNDWYPEGNDLAWNAKHEKTHLYDVYGNGVLVYCGAYVGIYGPVGSLRLECVRDGIEDFEYLTILEKHYGKETVDNVISRITTSLYKYTEDETTFTEVKIALGNLIEKTIKEGVIK